MKRAALVVPVVLSSCALPARDNVNDPAIRPEARLQIQALRIVPSIDEADLVVDGVRFRSIGEPRGGSEEWILLDGRGSSDPNQPAGSLSYEFELAGSDVAPTEARQRCTGEVGEPGIASAECLVLSAEDIRAVVVDGVPVRNAPIPVTLRVIDRDDNRGAASGEFLITDVRPVAAAGADYVLPRKTCAPGPACVHTVFLDGFASSDTDPVPADVAAPIRSYCWQQIPLLNGGCSAIAAAVVTEASPVDACPVIPDVDPACLRSARTLSLDVAASTSDGSSPSSRFLLWAADRFDWGEPDSVDVHVDTAPLWFRGSTGAVRFPGAYYRLASEEFPDGSGGRMSYPYHPTIANGPDGLYAYAIQDEGSNSNQAWAHRLGSQGLFEYFGSFGSNEGYELQARAAAHDASGRLWAALRAEDSTYPDHLFLVMTSGNAPYSAPDATGECSNPTPNEFCTIPPPDLLVANDVDSSAYGANRGTSELRVFTISGSVITAASFAATPAFTSIQALETATDGRLFVSDGVGSSARIRVFEQGAEIDEIAGLGEVDALRYDPAGEALWANVPSSGVWRVSLSDTSDRARMSAPVGAAQSIRLGGDGRLWIVSRFSNEILVADPAAIAFAPEVITLEGLGSGTSGVLPAGAPVISIFTGDELQSGVVRLPGLATALTGKSPSLGVLRDVSVDRDRGGAWFGYANPPSVVQGATDGSPFPATRFDRVTVGGTEYPLAGTWRLAADPASRALWVVDVPDPAAGTVISRWILADRSPPASPGPVTGLAYGVIGDDEPDEIVHRLRPALGGANPSAWAFVEDGASSGGKVVYTIRNGDGFTRTQFSAEYPVGPAVTSAGTAWFAKCQAPGSAFNFGASCNCQLPNNASFCNFGIRLAYATAGAGGVTNWVPTGAELGTCSGAGSLCSVYPLDVAYDRDRDVLWLAGLDHGDSSPPNQLRFWRFSCTTAGPLQNCASANILVAQRVPLFSDDPLETDLSLPNYSYQDLQRETPNLLSIDPGTGLAYFLDPLTHDVQILAYDSTTTPPSIRRAGSFQAPGMTSQSIDR